MPEDNKKELKELVVPLSLEEELAGQQRFLENTGTILIGRDKELRRIKCYLAGKKTPLPLIVHAVGGTGKSALMARAVMEIPPISSFEKGGEETTTPLTEVETGGFFIYRFVGATPRSWQPFTFLEDLIAQISALYDHEPPVLPEEGGIRALSAVFHEQLVPCNTYNFG